MQITIKSSSPNIRVTALLDEAGAVMTGGYGGWEIIPRPRRLALTHWTGRNPLSMSLAIILDGYKEGRSVESDCSALERLALPHPIAGGEPPIITVSGIAVPHNDLEWVIPDQIEWGSVIRNSRGYRLRQHAVVPLLRFVAVDKIQLSAAENARNKGGSNATPYVVVKGDTLAKIAAKKLGDSKRWKEIQKLNPSIRDPSNLKVGSTIKIPPRVKK